MIASILLIAFVLIAIFQSPWAWIGVVLVVMWKWRIWYRYNGRPWRRIHFNAMIYASAAVAREQMRSAQNQEAFNFRNMYIDTVKSMGDIGFHIDGDAGEFVDRQLSSLGEDYDENLMIEYLVEKRGLSFGVAYEKALAMKSAFESDADAYLNLRVVIAGLIEGFYTPMDRGEYWFEVLSNNAPDPVNKFV